MKLHFFLLLIICLVFMDTIFAAPAVRKRVITKTVTRARKIPTPRSKPITKPAPIPRSKPVTVPSRVPKARPKF
ncbi:hypothetical protein CAEBREN_28956 [Caenorhabditis brenneri]|uniref:Uncharacterized protein n=1 Tax=Caenorhabditis brenneri TaxID=135651 RepID=G0NRC4_CAEBE|nr:hypothetical protein CAEBREN_28956 [Caenorhabditis brenneri]